MKNNIAIVKVRTENASKEIRITNPEKPDIPKHITNQWQSILNLMAEILNVPAGLIMKLHSNKIEVFAKSINDSNPYKSGETCSLGEGLYCETVVGKQQTLIIVNAINDEIWKDNPDVKLNMVSYLGMPILWPDKEIFGTICVLDNKENSYCEKYIKLIKFFKRNIENDLEVLLENTVVKEKYHSLVSNIPGIIWTADENGSTSFISDNVAKIYGYTAEEIYNSGDKLFLERIHADDIDMVLNSFDNLINKNIPLDIEYRIKKKGGNWIWLHDRSTGTYKKEGKIFADGISVDITDKKKMEIKLRESENKFKTLFQQSHGGILIYNNSKGIVECNDAAIQLVGCNSKEEMLGIHPAYFSPKYQPDSKESIEKGRELTRQALKRNFLRFDWIHKNMITGDNVFVDVTLKPFEFNKQKFLFALWIDLSERKKAEEKLKQSEEKLKEAQNMAHLGYWIWDIKTGYVEWSDEVYNIFHLNADNFKPNINSILELSPWPEDHQRDKELIMKAVKSHKTGSYEQKFLRPDGSIGYYYSTFQGLYDSNNNLLKIKGIIQDITPKKRTKKELTLLKQAVETSSDAIVIVDTEGKYIYKNHMYKELFGKPENKNPLSVYIDYHTRKDFLMSAINKQWTGQLQMYNNNMEILDILLRTHSLKNEKGENIGLVRIHTNVTEIEWAHRELIKTQKFAQSTIESLPGIFYMFDKDKRYINWNKNFMEVTGLSEEEMETTSLFDLLKDKDKEHIENEIDKVFNKGSGNISIETDLLTKKRDRIPYYFTGRLHFIDKKPYLIGMGIDISERKRIENFLKKANKKLKEVAFKDSLTGVINKYPFINLVNHYIKYAERKNEKLALLFLDFDKFKAINDIHGHFVGDKVLIKAIDKIKKCIRSIDILGRFGGDEFVICLNDIKSLDNAIKIARKINMSFENGITYNNNTMNLSVSIGISIFPDNSRKADELFKCSDLAMYKAKNRDKNSYKIYKTEYKAELEMELALLKAFENKEFSIYYQPIVDKTGCCISIEALLRWNNTAFAGIPPDKFIPILERLQVINKVGIWVLDKACDKINQINSLKDFNNISISINLSRTQLEQNDFFENFYYILEKKKVRKQNLIFEMTEGQRIKDMKKTVDIFNNLKKKSIGYFALDDYGAGCTSFNSLLNLPVDIVKLDKNLLKNIDCDKSFQAVSGIISLLKRLNFKVIAEGVETEEQFKKLRLTECDYFQGFYFSKPVVNIVETLQTNKGIFIGNSTAYL